MPDELQYHPVLVDANDFLERFRPARFLLVGNGLPPAFDQAAESRYISDPSVELATGIYRYTHDEGELMVVVREGSRPDPPLSGSFGQPECERLERSYDWCWQWWNDAAQIPNRAFVDGDVVQTVPGGQEAHIRHSEFYQGQWAYSIRVEGHTRSVAENEIAHIDVDDDPYDWIDRNFAPARHFAAELTRAKLTKELTDTVYSFRATRTTFRPYQFRPVMRLLSTGEMRLLIADEVGLGKTIEAGLVWTELDARSQANRVLVVCPSMLVGKWQAEMDERFGFDLVELDRGDLDDLLERLETDRWQTRYHAVCSLQRLRSWSGLERFTELAPRFDLVIVDEAHHLRNRGTASNTLGHLLSDWSDTLLFLSATPLNLGNDDLFNLLELLAPGEFEDRINLEQRLEPNAVLTAVSKSLLDASSVNPQRLAKLQTISDLTFGPAILRRPEYRELEQLLMQDTLLPAQIAEAKHLIAELHALSTVVTRTRKVEVEEGAVLRIAQAVPVHLTETEAELYNAIYQWQLDRAAARSMPVGFIGQMPLRLAGSCLPATRDSVLDQHRSPSGEFLDPHESDIELDNDSVPPIEVVEAAKALGEVDTKFEQFVERLQSSVDQGHKILVFSFFLPTIDYLEGRLTSKFRVASITGKVDAEERRDLMRRFRGGEFDVLLASRVASEGLDFEFCSAVVNYDLPWNPMELEQRIGRIDRFGQTEEAIHVVNFHTPGTIETDIIEAVHERIGVFTRSIGELEPIIQSELPQLRQAMFDWSLSDEQRKTKIQRSLVAIETRALALEEVENAADYLNTVDNAEIDGFEDQVVNQGRYIGQPELVQLIEDWVSTSPGASCRVSEDGLWLVLRGNAPMEEQLRSVQAAGERSAAELEKFGRFLRNEQEIHVCLDQETARMQAAPLLNATNPLVRAALRVPAGHRARCSAVRIREEGVEAGRYLALVSVADWNGIRGKTEFWTTVVDENGQPASTPVGEAVLASLARGELEPGDELQATASEELLAQCLVKMRQRQDHERSRRQDENEALAESRRISLQETHNRKIRQIQKAVDTLRRDGNERMAELNRRKLDNQNQLLQDRIDDLEGALSGSLEVEHIAVCFVEVE